jgi:ribose/xylose/arabinose/galactoside ABC-type transport system permease subunit
MAGQENAKLSISLGRLFSRSTVPSLVLAYVLFLLVFSLINPVFISVANIKNIIVNLGILGIVALGVSLVMLTGNVDISVGSNFLFTSVIVMQLFNLPGISIPPIIVIICAVVLGSCFGALNGFLVTVVGINSVITTLGTMSLLKGAGQLLAYAYAYNGKSITNAFFLSFGRGYLFHAISLPFVYLLILIFVFWVILKYTKFGRDVYTTGANVSLARLFGVKVKKTQFVTFLISGALAGFAAALTVAQLARSDPYFGQGLEFQALTVAVLGGISLLGGRGTLIGVLVAILIVGSISNGLAVVKVTSNLREAINGLILIAAILLDALRQRSFGARKLA